MEGLPKNLYIYLFLEYTRNCVQRARKGAIFSYIKTMSDSQTTRFKLARIDNFSEAKARVEGLKGSMSGIADVNLGGDRWATFLQDPSTTDAQIST
ncbi:hypothetical protein SUGI_0732900 [Cryptomeria japonica]|nr:hypothetical protein SUGI_0732900 [Cryptomeria japonica]